MCFRAAADGAPPSPSVRPGLLTLKSCDVSPDPCGVSREAEDEDLTVQVDLFEDALKEDEELMENHQQVFSSLRTKVRLT